MLADVLPARAITPDGRPDHRRARAFVYPDAVYLYFQDQPEPDIYQVVGQLNQVRNSWWIEVSWDGGVGMLKLVQQGCGGCSPLRRLTAPRQP